MQEDPNNWCFVCGPNNPIGLKLSFELLDDQYVTTFTPGPQHQGYNGILHGGLISTVLDEIMAGYIHALGKNAVTARLEVRFRHPTPIGQKLKVVGKIAKHRGKLYEMAGTIELPDGTITAEGTSTVMVVEE